VGYLTDIYSVEGGEVRRLTDGLLRTPEGTDERAADKTARDRAFPLAVLMRMLGFSLESAQASAAKDRETITAHIAASPGGGGAVDATVRATFFLTALALLERLPPQLVAAGFDALAASHLRRVVVATVELPEAARLRLVQTLPAAHLRDLRLNYLGLGDEGAKALGDCPGTTAATPLQVLWLFGNGITDLSPLVPALANATQLKRLSLQNNRIADLWPLAPVLANATHLELLRLDDNPSSESSKEDIRKAWGSRGGELRL
jgi:hypothetical protein